MEKQTGRKQVFVGIGKAVDRVPQWHADRFMKIYDRFHYKNLSLLEKEIADETRSALEKRAKALGWIATGMETAIVLFGIVKGYKTIKNRRIPHAVPTLINDTDSPVVKLSTPPYVPDAEYHGPAIEELPSIYFPGVRVERKRIKLPKLLRIQQERYNRILDVCDGNQDEAQAFLLAAQRWTPYSVRESTQFIVDQFGIIHRAGAVLKDDGALHEILTKHLPKGQMYREDSSFYITPLFALEQAFAKAANAFSPKHAFSYWAATYFPWLHHARNIAIDAPNLYSGMVALKNAYERVAWRV